MAAKIDRKADDLISTINDYFTMSKIASGDLPIKLKKENVSRLCQDTILDYYDLLEQKQFEVDIQIPDTPIFAYTDNEALQRILKNLCSPSFNWDFGCLLQCRSYPLPLIKP